MLEILYPYSISKKHLKVVRSLIPLVRTGWPMWLARTVSLSSLSPLCTFPSKSDYSVEKKERPSLIEEASSLVKEVWVALSSARTSRHTLTCQENKVTSKRSLVRTWLVGRAVGGWQGGCGVDVVLVPNCMQSESRAQCWMVCSRRREQLASSLQQVTVMRMGLLQILFIIQFSFKLKRHT